MRARLGYNTSIFVHEIAQAIAMGNELSRSLEPFDARSASLPLSDG
jgi:hypothetical protein